MEHFRTERLIVRDWAEDDAPAALGIYGREEVTRWLGSPPMRPVESQAAMTTALRRMTARSAEHPGFGLWPVQRVGDGVLVGAILLSPVARGAGEAGVARGSGEAGGAPGSGEAGGAPGSGEAGGAPGSGEAAADVEIGWHFNPDYWGNGYATEAASGVIGLAFTRRDLDRVIAVVYPDNTKSLALCRRLGMTHHGRTDQYYGVMLELFSLSRTG